MKTKLLFLPIAALTLMCPLPSAIPAPPVTFELLSSFDYPGGTNTNARAINDRGNVAGSYTASDSSARGFVRFRDGRFTRPITEPNDTGGFTVLSGLNNLGTACGFYSVNGAYHSFLFSDSMFTEVPIQALNRNIEKINDAGNFCGYTTTPNAAIVSIAGTLTAFTIPGGDTPTAFGINNLNEVVGSYFVGLQQFGFRREADGTLDYPIAGGDATATTLFGINDKGWMVGRVGDGIAGHGALFRSPNEFTLYDYPGASYTDFEGINNRGLICGTYFDAAGVHGFIVRVRSAVGD